MFEVLIFEQWGKKGVEMNPLKGVVVPALTLVNAQDAVDCNAFGRGLERLVRRVVELRDALLLAGPCWISGLKYAVSLLGIGAGTVVSPLEPANEAQMLAVKNLMAQRR
ncbi:MAG: hypothetical protein WCS01_12025 [bacterium]